jgi:Asp-tRNA(Asn)/Glu-tRNA(Gln) amidotransferase C subunit
MSMQKVSETSADVFAERMEDVTRLFKQYEQSKAEKNAT